MAFQKVGLTRGGAYPLITDSAHVHRQIRLLGGKLGEAIAAEYGVEIVGDML